jgi:hypothetical protein
LLALFFSPPTLFFSVLGIDPSASYMLGRYSTTWAMAPAL